MSAKKKEGPLYPEVKVKLSGQDGNVFFIIGRVKDALKRGPGLAAANVFMEEAISQESYDKVLQLCMKTVTVE